MNIDEFLNNIFEKIFQLTFENYPSFLKDRSIEVAKSLSREYFYKGFYRYKEIFERNLGIGNISGNEYLLDKIFQLAKRLHSLKDQGARFSKSDFFEKAFTEIFDEEFSDLFNKDLTRVRNLCRFFFLQGVLSFSLYHTKGLTND